MLNTGNLVGALDTITHLDRELSLAFEYANALPVHQQRVEDRAADGIVPRLLQALESAEAQIFRLGVHALVEGEIHDDSTRLLDEIASLNRACFLARLAVESWRDRDSDSDARHMSYRSTAASANRVFVAIGEDPDLARFLRAGLEMTSQPFQSACRALATLLDVDLALDQVEQ